MNWKEIYQLPITYDEMTYGWTKNDNMALMFDDDLSEEDRIDIIKVINGESDKKIKNLSSNGCDIYKGDRFIFCVRGWGLLTGALRLSEEDAAKIQDDFVKYILDRLSY